MARLPLFPQPRDLRGVPGIVIRRFENKRPSGKGFVADDAHQRLRRQNALKNFGMGGPYGCRDR